MRNERETAFCMFVPTRGKGMQFGTHRTPNPACARTYQSHRHTSNRICDNVGNCQVFSHTSSPVNIDKIPPTVTLSNPAYVNEYRGIPSSIKFPPVTRYNDFALTISDNQAVQSVSAFIQYWDGSSETITPLTLNNDHSTTAFTSGRSSFNALITVKKSGTAIITVTIRDTAGNEIKPVYTIDSDFIPRLHLDTAAFVDFRTQTLVITPQDFARTTPPSADARYKKGGSSYNLMGTGAAITPNFHYILKTSAGVPVRDFPAQRGEGVLTLSTNLSNLPDGEYRLFAIYSDFLKNSSGADIPNVVENPQYASNPAIILVDNTDAPSATNPASPRHLTFSPAVPAPEVVAASGHVGTQNCDATGVAVLPRTVQVPQTQKPTSITFLKCQADVQATGFATEGKRDIYILSAKQLASKTEKLLPPARQAMVMIAVAPEVRGTADNMTADSRIIRADEQVGATDAAKVQAVATQMSTVAPVKIGEVQANAISKQSPETIPPDAIVQPIVAPSNLQELSPLNSLFVTGLNALTRVTSLTDGKVTVYTDVNIDGNVRQKIAQISNIQYVPTTANPNVSVMHALPSAVGLAHASPNYNTPGEVHTTTVNSSENYLLSDIRNQYGNSWTSETVRQRVKIIDPQRNFNSETDALLFFQQYCGASLLNRQRYCKY